MSRIAETLAKIELFRSLDTAAIQLLDTQCSWRRVESRQWIINYQDSNTDVFFVVSGTVQVKIQAISGREVLLREINAGEYFGELAAIDNQTRSAGIIAVTDVVVARMPASVFRTTLHAYPDACDGRWRSWLARSGRSPTALTSSRHSIAGIAFMRNYCGCRNRRQANSIKPWCHRRQPIRSWQPASASGVKPSHARSSRSSEPGSSRGGAARLY